MDILKEEAQQNSAEDCAGEKVSSYDKGNTSEFGVGRALGP